jgi:DNA-binding IscR family transcriptional regulator
MRRDSRLSVALHVLLHMPEDERAVTSEDLATSMRMNAVVLRRTLSALRDAGILRGEKGHGGGWALARDLADVSLGDVLDALGTTLFAIGPRNEKPGCPIEQDVDRAIAGVLGEAEELIGRRLHAIPVASILAKGRRHPPRKKELHVHA